MATGWRNGRHRAPAHDDTESADRHPRAGVDERAAILRRIVERASTLDERLNGPFVHCNAPEPLLGTPDERLARWRAVVGGDEPDAFARYLAWNGLTEDRVLRALGTVCLPDYVALPSWACLLSDVVDRARNAPPIIPSGTAIPFESLLAPFVATACMRVAEKLASADVSHHGWPIQDLARALVQQLSMHCAPALFVEFESFRALRQKDDGARPPHAGHLTPSEAYEAFIAEGLSDGLLSFWTRVPVLARLASVCTEDWIDASAELLTRLMNDAPLIDAHLGGGVAFGPVIGIQINLSDPHRGGRTVAAIRFGGDRRVVYKPHSLRVDRAFGALVDWLDASEPESRLKALAVLDLETHGYVEHVRACPCDTAGEVDRYYERAGRLLCLAYLLGGGDLHAENIIACGAHPVLVDLEVLLGAPVAPFESTEHAEVTHGAARAFTESVLRPMMLPEWATDASGSPVARNGLGGCAPTAARRTASWPYANTDFMTPLEAEASSFGATHLPVLDGVSRTSSAHVAALTSGFTAMYEQIHRRRAALLESDGPLGPFATAPVRVVLRNTRLYSAVLRRSLLPEHLRSGADRSIELQVLSRPLLRCSSPPHLWRAMGAECADLERCDIPIFTAQADGRSVLSSDGVVVGRLAAESGYVAARRRVEHSSPDDLQLQCALIGATHDMDALGARRFAARADGSSADAGEHSAPLSPVRALAAARELSERLEQLAVRQERGSVSWIGARFESARDRHPLGYADFSFAHGSTGIAYFLAAYEHVSGVGHFRPLMREALSPLLAAIADDPLTRVVARYGLGGASGVGGVIYALSRIAGWQGDAEFQDAAARVAHALSNVTLASDECLDVCGGVAGTALGLLQLYHQTAEPGILQAAVRYGMHLLERRTRGHYSGHRAWRTAQGRVETGFAHGTPGIAHALLGLYRATGGAAFLGAVRDAHALEDTLLSYAAEMPWNVDARTDDPRARARPRGRSWCHGAAGVGLARTAARDVLGASYAGDAIDGALAACTTGSLRGPDHLCCGHFGRIDFLVTAAAATGRADLMRTAQQCAAEVVARGHRRNGYSLGGRAVLAPGFLNGMAGIGYQLLRLADPRLPSALLWA